MIRHILQRILYTLPALWLILTMVFLMIHIVPGDPVLQMLGQDARVEDLAQLRHTLGLDQPLGVQYAAISRGARARRLGPLAFALRLRCARSCCSVFPQRLNCRSRRLLVCIAIAIPAGVFSAWRRGSRADRATSFFTLLGLSVPNFALGPILILVFSVEIGWLPVSGRGGVSHLILPAVTLGAALAAILTRMVRGSMIEELSSDYVRTARAKGISETSVLFRHAFPNALIPVITIVGLQFGSLLAGTIVTESIFSWPGIGRLAVQAISARDYPLLQGCILVIAVSYVGVNLLTDLVYAVVIPGCGCNDGLGQIREKSHETESPIRQFLRTSGLGRWGLAVTVLLVARGGLCAVDRAGKSLRAEPAGALAVAERASLDGNGRTGPRRIVAHTVRRASFAAGRRVGGARRGNRGAGARFRCPDISAERSIASSTSS